MKALTKNVSAVFIVLVGMVLALCLCGCSSGNSSSESSSEPAAEQTKDFDGANATDTGDGAMYIATAGGTSEDENVPEIAGEGTIQISVCTEDMDGSVCTVYVDGMENTTMNAGAMTQQSITLEGDDLKQGEHTVELVKLDDSGKPVIYKVAQYKVA